MMPAPVRRVDDIRMRQAKARRLVDDLALLGRGLERRHAAEAFLQGWCS
jgi:hypothetical protein